jgi:uncharacterized protein (TIGR02186 family)
MNARAAVTRRQCGWHIGFFWLLALMAGLFFFGAVSGNASGAGDGEARAQAFEDLPTFAREAAGRSGAKRERVPPPDWQWKEVVQADVSTRQVAVTSSFTGTQLVVFGAVDNSRQPSAESGYYDVVVVVEGTPKELVARRKSNVAGLWLNTQSLAYNQVPSYYAIASTRPLDEVAEESVLAANEIGFEHVKFVPARGEHERLAPETARAFRAALVRLKQRSGLFVKTSYGVVFTGRSLFRASINLPANVTVGPFDTRVYLFHNGELLSKYTASLNLEREGLERFLHSFAFGRPFLYGLVTVIIAVAAGLAASAIFSRASH